MCGITGAIWTREDLAIAPETLEKMTTAIRHRGPDDAGEYRNELATRSQYGPVPGIALGFRRLSIIDLAGGHQPMSNEDGSVWIVFNGEIYNYPALRRRLEGNGHQFKTDSDTETIVHLYEDLGPECLTHLEGMFALAIWDAKHKRLMLARDRLGKKPLFYRYEPGRLIFGSELKCLMAVSGIAREVDPNALDAYLTYQYVPHPQCILKGFNKLPPATYALFDGEQLKQQTYWYPDFSREIKISEADAIARTRELVTNAVRMRMRSDVPLGTFLSGGVDSSIVAAVMQNLSERPVKTFTIGFPAKDYDETEFAREVARHLNTEHHESIVEPKALEILPKLAEHYDEPFADSSALPTWRLSELTRQHVTVALSGDGGDELFAGYERYSAVRLARSIDRWGILKWFLAHPMWQRVPSSGTQRSRLRQFKRFSESLGQSPVRRYLEWMSIFNEGRRVDLYTDEFISQLSGPEPGQFLTRAWQRAGSRDPVQAASLADLTTYLPCALMTKVDIASMANSLEVRCPFLDHPLVEFAASLPLALKLRFGKSKRLLQLAFGDMLPKRVFTRRKMGFGVPLAHWFRGELKPLLHEVLGAPRSVAHGWLRLESIARLRQEHETGKFDHSARLWSLLMLEMWLRRWLPT